ncbi:uncharacterized protein LOC121736609 [Aricia agestis]|uniref:uncharacterized protein LOC121736609 n=1 Tax=Aricia agestis TaxID=91739 RepID=UPI001C205E90|nr:uncharacterized protein LOC121736609 [Aricia agestis]
MQKHDWEEEPRSRPSSRRNSASLSRRGSLNKEPEGKKINVTPSSANSTPKRVYKPQYFDFTVTGKQISARGDRANSLPGSYHRRPSVDSMLKTKRSLDSARKTTPKSRESLDDDMSLDLSQVSDFEDMNAKYGLRGKIASMSTKKTQKPRSSSLQSVPVQREPRRLLKSADSKRSRENTLSCSRDSLYKTSSTYRQAMSSELEYSSMSPEYSAPSSVSVDSGPGGRQDTLVSPPSQDPPDYSCCVSTWQEVSEAAGAPVVGAAGADEGEWSHFWANYNNSLARVPVSRYYDQCPTPYRTEDIELADLEFSDISKKRSPDNLNAISHIVRNEGLRLTPRETQNIIKCAHILGNVLSKAIDRQSQDRKSPEKVQELRPESDPAYARKKSLTLNLRETVMPLEVKEEKRWESVPTQTDISLPNTKSAPRIFESILRQLSKSSLEDAQNKEVKKEEPPVSEP